MLIMVDDLSIGQIKTLKWNLSQGSVQKHDIKKLLNQFVRKVRARKDVEHEVEFVAHAIGNYLMLNERRIGNASLDKSFGLIGKTTGPEQKDSSDRDLELAVEVLRLRLSGKNAPYALDEVSRSSSFSHSTVEGAFKENKRNAFISLGVEHILKGRSWPPRQHRPLKILKKIFPSDPDLFE